MKKGSIFFFGFLLFVQFLFVGGACGQSTANYTFSTNTTGSLALDANGNAIDMTTGTSQLVAASSDATVSSVTSIGFNYYFMSNLYSQFTASADGIIGLGSTAVSGNTVSGGSITTPRISALGGDFYVSASGKVHYKLVGSAPSRCLVIEWTGMAVTYNTTAANGNSTWQVRLYETTGVVEYVYGAINCSSTTYNPASAGFSVNTTANNTASITFSNNSVSNGATFNTNTLALGDVPNLNSTANGSRRVYKFTPPTPAAGPSNLTFASVTTATTTLNWTAASPTTNIVRYIVFNSTNGGTIYNFVANVALGTNTYSATGLTSGTNYTWKVVSVSEGAEGAFVNGSQATVALSPMTGVYTINNTAATSNPVIHDGTSNFANFTAAINYMNIHGIAGPVILNVSAGQTFNEITPSITATGTSTNSITFQKYGSGTNPKITPAGSSGTLDFGININGGDYFTFDGIDIDASASSAVELGYYISNSSATNGAQNNTVKNSSILLANRGSSNSCYGIDQNTVITPTSVAGANSNNNYYNLTISGVKTSGVYLNSSSTTYPDLSCKIGTTDCLIRNSISNIGATTSTTVSARGIYAYGQNGLKLWNNDISLIAGDQAATQGIYFVNCLGTTNEIYANNIQSISVKGSTTTTSIAYGVQADLGTNASSNVKIYNNYISNIFTSFTSTATASRYALGIFTGVSGNVATQTFEIDNNNISIGQGLSPTYSNSCFEVQNGTPIYKVRGNIFSNSSGSQGATSKHFNIVVTAAGIGGSGSVFDYNNYFIANDQNTSGHIGRNQSTSTNYNSLTDWKTFTTGTLDETSLSVNPLFSSLSNLATSNTVLNAVSGFTPQSWVTSDIVCSDRSTKTPNDIGAFAFDPPAAPTITNFNLSDLCVTGGQTVTLTGTNFVGITGVSFNGLAATTYTVVSPTSITAVTPANLTDGLINVTNSAGTGSSLTGYVSRPTPAIPIVSTAGTYCSNTTITASNSNDGTIYWQNNTATGTSTATPSSSQLVSASGTYYYRAQSSFGCWSNAGSAAIVINTPISITTDVVTTTQNKCLNATGAALSVSVAGTSPTYQWYSNTTNNTFTGTAISSGGTSSTFTPLTTTAGTTYYYCVISSVAPCNSAVTSAVATVVINSLPTITGGTSVCSGQTLQLSGSGNADATTPWISGTTSFATITSSGLVTGVAGGSSIITYKDANGCSSTQSVLVNISPSAISITPNPTSICLGGITTLTASGGTIPTTPSQYAFSTSTGTYTAITGTAVTAAIGDDYGIGNLPIGFTFNYNGIAQTVFGVSSNGMILLGNTTAAWTASGTYSSNALATTANIIAPLWDDNNTTGGTVIYSTTGNAPNRILTVQWTGMHVAGSGSSTSPTINMQALLFENGNIQFIYGAQSAALSSPTASIGISGASGNYISVTPLNPLSTSTTSSSSENISVATSNIPTGTILTFTKPTAPVLLWSPSTDLYSNNLATTAYSNENSNIVYSKSNSSQTYTISSTTNVCSVSQTITVSPIALPTITLSSATSVCVGGTSSSLGYTATTGSPNQYTIDYNSAANTAGFQDISTFTAFSSSPISLVVPAGASSGTYSGTITVKNSSTGCSSLSTSFSVTINDNVAITTQPTNQSAQIGANAQFNVVAVGSNLTYQWQEFDGTTYSNISGATSSTLTISSVIANDNGRVFRCVVSGTCGFENTSNATLTASSIGITTQPADATICNSGSTTLSMVTSGTITNYQWQISTDNQTTWTDISGETNATLALSGLSYSSPAKVYRCNLNNGTLFTNGATVTVYDQIAITSQPTTQTICTGTSSVSFSVTTSGSNPTYQWQVSTNSGSTWANVASGGTGATYALSNPADALNGNQYRVIVTGSSPCTAVTSNVVTLNVIYATIASSVASGCINSVFTLTATLNGNPTSPTYSWECPTTGSGATTAITSNPASITPTATGTFIYTLTAGSTECPTITKTINYIVNALPTITTATATQSTVCSGEVITLTGTSVLASSGTATVGNGASSSSTYSNPFYSAWSNNHTQHLIKAAELIASGLVAGNITSVGLNVTSVGSLPMINLSVKIGATSATAMTSFVNNSGFQTVYTNASLLPTSGNNILTFTTPFNWDGVSNIVLEFCHGNSASTSTMSRTVQSDVTGYVSSIKAQISAATAASTICSDVSSQILTYSERPKFIFGGQIGTNQTSSYSWSWNSTPAINTASGTTTETNTSGSATTKTYTVTATNASTGCVNTATTSAITINPATITPTATNSSQCGTATPTCSVSGTGTSGNTFKWYTVATGGTALTGQTASTLTSYPISATTSFYVSEFNGTCESPRVQVTASVTAAPSITASASVNPVCSGSATSLTATSANSGYSYSWSNGAGTGASVSVNPTSATTYTVTGTDNSSGANNGCVSSATIAVTTNALPSAITLTPTTSTDLCMGDVKTIVASGGVGSETVTTVLNENFNAATNGWTTVNSSTTGTTTNAAWTLRANSYSYSSTTFNSNDNSQFYMTNSDAQGSGTTLTTLTSPAFSTLGSTSSTINFYHYFKISDAGRVQYSLDGTNFTTITTYTSTVGSNSAFVLASINLPAGALNKPVVYIRFRFEATYDWYWAIDNVTINNSIPQISWSPSTALYADAAATTAYTGSPTTVYSKPTSTTTYTASATNAAGCTSSASVTVNVAAPSSQTVANNDFVWRGTTNTQWSTASNWVKFDGTSYAVASTSPVATDNVFIPQNNTCVVNQPSIGTGTVAAKAVYIEPSATVTGGSGTLDVKGNFTNNGTFTAGTGTVSFSGTTAQQITGATTFYNLTENNSAGLTLNSPVMVSNGLTMTAGDITTSSTNLLALGNSAPATLAWTSGKVVGPMKRWIAAATNSGASSSLFPLGNATRKAQASIEYTTAPTTAGYLEAKFIATSPANSATNAYTTLTDQYNYVLDNLVTEGYWEIKPSATTGVAGGTYTVKLEGETISLATSTNASYTDVRVIKSPDPHTSWILEGDHGAATGTNSDFTVSRTGMSGYSFFAMAFPSAAPLPVELVSFAANCEENNTVAVNWTTASEHNSDYYTVEKSRDGSNWNVLKTIPAAGNSTQLLNYSVADASDISGTIYYRLTQVDVDGALKVYDIVSTNCFAEKELTLLAYPNPSNGQFSLKIENAKGGKYDLAITDMQGKTIDQQSIDLESGTTVVKLNPANVQPGVYLLQFIQNGNVLQQQKLVIE